MVLIRHYSPSDAPELDRLLDNNRSGDVRLERDRIVVAGSDTTSKLLGCLIWRPSCFVHELRLGSGLIDKRGIAGKLYDYAKTDVLNSSYKLYDANFISSDPAMIYFAESLGAVHEHLGTVLTVPVRKVA